jgi:hypothetical protein
MLRVTARPRVAGVTAALAVMLSSLVAVGAAGAERLAEPVVTPSQQVTKELRPGRGYTNSQVLVHPEDPNIMVIAHADFLTSTCLLHVSRDAGRTWAQAPTNPVPPKYKACTRPAFGAFMNARFGPDGTLYFASTGADTATNRGPTDGYVARSTDLGETWQFSVVATPVEREFTRFDGSKVTALERFNYARVATHPTDPKRVAVGFRVETAEALTPAPPVRSVIAVSTDGGITFSKPVDNVEQTIPRNELAGSDAPAMAIGDDGAIYAFTKERAPGGGITIPTQPTIPQPPGEPSLCLPASANPAIPPAVPNPTAPPPKANEPGAGTRLIMSKSTDDGKSWKSATIDDGGLACIGCLTIPETAVDPKTGAVYVAFELSETPLPNPRDDRNIFFMSSTDGGATWSKRLKVNDDDDPNRKPNYDQFIPGISVAPNGRIDIAWYDMRTDGWYNPAGRGDTGRRDQTCWDVYMSSSFDGGRTFGRNVRVSDRTMNQNSGFALNLAYDLRAPIGVVATDEASYVTWPDSRNGTFGLPTEDTYVAMVTHEQEPADEGGLSPVSVFLGLAVGLVIAGLAVFAVSRRRAALPTAT